ncbi:MAG: hypothetical protein KIT79_08160 [Deltaproteobacteria bacterium]|nr:hypothetical protein [Deltaproteobacteria bacterium]
MSDTQFNNLGFRRLGPSAQRDERLTLSDVVETLATAKVALDKADVARSVGRLINAGRIRFQGDLKGLKVRVTDN